MSDRPFQTGPHCLTVLTTGLPLPRLSRSSAGRLSSLRAIERRRIRNPHSEIRNAFTLVELLVVIAIVATLLAVLLPSLAMARQAAGGAVCGSNLRQLAIANLGYAAENRDYLVPAAPDIWSTGGGVHRWHGVRNSALPTNDPNDQKFDPLRGPLAAYLADGRVKRCPAFTEFRDDPGSNAYESGCGGYGYNQLYVGSRHWIEGYYFESPGQLLGALTTELRDPASTILFTDAALPQANGGGLYFTEESFCYPPRMLHEDGSEAPEWGFATPDIHFRHRHRAEVAWSDGHVGSQKMDFTLEGENVYGADSRDAGVGWFGPQDNSLFDVYPH